MSLATRVSVFFLFALVLVLAGFSATLYLLARAHLQRDLDERLTLALDTLSASAEVESNAVEWKPLTPRAALEIHPGEEPVEWMVCDARGNMIDRFGPGAEKLDSHVLVQVPNLGHAHLSTESADGHSWRLAVRRLKPIRAGRPSATDDDDDDDDRRRGKRKHATNWGGASLILAAFAPLEPMEARLNSVGLTLAGLSIALWIVTAIVGRWLCRRALLPVSEMARAAGAMSVDDRERQLPSPGTGDELEVLARSFNGLLDRLHEALERQRRFTGDASHQLRTPLTALLGQLEVARRRDRSADDYRRVLDQVQDEATQLRQIVESLLFLARAEVDAGIPEFQRIDLSEWIPRQLTRWSTHRRAGDLQGDTEGTAPLWVRVHPPLLGQLLDNLIENACKYSAPGTGIRVRCWRDGMTICMAVEDRGIGIRAEDRPHVFEPFFRASEARRRGDPGIGLGLAMVQRIAATFGGSIALDSEVGRGSRFIVKLPEAKLEPSPADHAETAGAPERSIS